MYSVSAAGHRGRVAVAPDDVGDVVADHASEPPALVAQVGEVVAHVRRGGDADRDLGRVATGGLGRGPHGADRPRRDLGVGELEDEAVADLAGQGEGPGSVAGDPQLEPAPAGPRERDRRALVVDRPAVAELADHVDRLAQRVDRGRLAVRDAHRRVAPADAADGAVAVHLVERGEHAGGHRPVPGGRVGDHRADDDVAGLGQDLAVDDVWLLPQDVAVERPDVAEPVRLRPLGEVDDARRRRRRLEHHPQIHQRVSGKPKSTLDVCGSGHLDVTTLPRV